MSEFSEYLEKSIKSRGFTNSEFAKMCGIERTLLQKYLSGQRLFKKHEILRLICEKLHLSPDEKEQMEDKYRKALLGGKLYEQRKMVRDLIESFQQLSSKKAFSKKRTYKFQIDIKSHEKMIFYENKEDFLHEVCGVLGYEVTKPDCYLAMIFQPVYKELESLLLRLGQKEKVSIHHIVCMEQESYEAGGKYNLQILQKLVPFLCSDFQYHVRYYYERVKNHINSMNILPNIILTPEFVICFDCDMKHGMILSDPSLRKFYQKVFDSINEKCEDFILRQQDGLDSLRFYQQQSPIRSSLQWSPCIAQCISKKMLEEILAPEILKQRGVLEEISVAMGKAFQSKENGEQYVPVHFFTREGLRNFMETGRTREFPVDLYQPLTMPQRLRVEDTFRQLIQSERMDVYLLREKGLKLENSLIVQYCADHSIQLIWDKNEKERAVLVLCEDSIVEAFLDYLDSLKESEQVEERAVLLRYLEEIQNEFKSQEGFTAG